MSSVIVFDTSIFVDQLRTARHQARIEAVAGLVRTSAVVLAELWRGALKKAERDFLNALTRNHPVLTPTEKNWIESGQILGKIRAETGYLSEKIRDLHF